MDLQHKLCNFRKSLKLNQVKFAETLGFSQGTIANMESGKREVSKPVLLKIKEVYSVDLMSFGETEKKTTETSNVVAIKFYSNIQAAAGLGNYATNDTQSEVLYFDKRWLKNIIGINPQNAFIIQAQGESMDSGLNKIDDIKDGDLLMVDTSKLEGNNKIYVISLNNEIRVKRLFYNLDGSLTISSNNSKYQDEQYKAEDANFINIQVLGRVVWNGSKENV